MQAIIKQNSQAPTLPDLRNLGTVLRILLAVNGAAIVVAFAGEPRWGGMSNAWAVLAAYVEPQLLADLAIFWLLQPALQRMPYPAGCATVTGIVAAVTLGFHGLIDPGLPLAPSTLLRELVFSVTVTAALLYYFQLRAKALSPAIAEARLQALQARIRPHFLFNSLNAVLSLIRSEPDRAEAALEDLAELFRVLMRDNRELAPLADEVNLCRQYLDLEKLRLGERLVVEWNVKSMPDDALVPPLVLQPLLENAVYHGIEPSSSPGVLSINIFGSRDEIHAILRNPHIENQRSRRGGNKMAIANVRERLALHFDAEASLESRVAQNHYEVHIRMPYRTSKTEHAAKPAQPEQRATPPIRNDARKERSRALPVRPPGLIPLEVNRG